MATCTPELIAQLTAWLAEANQSLHNLNTGRMPRVVVDQNGERVEFTAANRSGLVAYINSLTAQLAACTCSAGVESCVPSGPAQFIF